LPRRRGYLLRGQLYYTVKTAAMPAAIALLDDYMAASLVTPADVHRGAVAETLPSAEQALLAHLTGEGPVSCAR
jgi:hypothetical protein